MLQATQNVSTDYALANQLTRALRVLENHQTDEEAGQAYCLVKDLVTALSRVESISAHAALARSAALIGDLYALVDVMPKDVKTDLRIHDIKNRAFRLAWQSLFFLEDEFLTTAESAGLDYFAPMRIARALFPGMDRPDAVELAEAAE
jgi:hypothetical protein